MLVVQCNDFRILSDPGHQRSTRTIILKLLEIQNLKLIK